MLSSSKFRGSEEKNLGAGTRKTLPTVHVLNNGHRMRKNPKEWTRALINEDTRLTHLSKYRDCGTLDPGNNCGEGYHSKEGGSMVQQDRFLNVSCVDSSDVWQR